METVRKPFALDRRIASKMEGKDQIIRVALEEIGLSQPEIALYKTSLSLGPRPASTLARGIRVQRTRVYDLLSSLQARGLIETVERNRIRYYAATPPERLLSLIRDRREFIETHLAKLESAIPSLFSSSQSFITCIESRTFRGTALVKEALEALLEQENASLFAVGDIEQVLRSHVGLSRWAINFREKRISQGITLKISVQGPPDLLVEKALLRETLSSPDIPAGVLAVAGAETVLIVDLSSSTVQATSVNNQVFCLILQGLYSAWRHAVERIS